MRLMGIVRLLCVALQTEHLDGIDVDDSDGSFRSVVAR